MKYRKGETGKTYYRVDRFFIENGHWGFITREGTNMGPFANRKEAERELDRYIQFKNNAGPAIDFELAIQIDES